MLSWNRDDELFLDRALDPQRRHKVLGKLGRGRALSFILAIVYMIALPFASLAESQNQGLVVLGSLAGIGILFSLIYAKLQSELLLLKYIDRLERDKRARDANNL